MARYSLYTRPLDHCRLQWSSGSMSDCSAQGPGIESRCGQFRRVDMRKITT